MDETFPTWLAARLTTPLRAQLHLALEAAGHPRSPSAITAWLKGRGTPEPACLPVLVDVLGLTAAEDVARLYELCAVPLHPNLWSSDQRDAGLRALAAREAI